MEVLECLSANKKVYNVILENYPSLLICRSTSDKGLNKLAEDALATTRVPVTMSMKIKKAKIAHPQKDDPMVSTNKLIYCSKLSFSFLF